MTRISETEKGFELLNNDTRFSSAAVKTFGLDPLLPSLPLPPLNHTLDKYLKSIRPFVSDLEYLTTQKKVENFRNGVGKVLQFHLRTKANKEKNWLEKWWFDWAYLEWREPLLPYVSTSGICIDSPKLVASYDRLKKFGIDVQAARMAILINAYVKFFEELRNETLPVHKSRSTYFSMDQFRRFFNTCRLPHKDKDKLVNYFRTIQEGDCATHIIVMFKNRFFKLDAYCGHDKKLLDVREFYHQLMWILSEYEPKSYGVGIGALTADRRDSWAQNRDYLINLDPKNLECLKLIEKSLFMVNLERIECITNEDISYLVYLKNPKNRFFDKPYQLVSSKNAMIGSNIEHAPFDGMVTQTITEYALRIESNTNIDSTTFNMAKNDNILNKPTELEFVYDSKIEREIESCAKLFDQLCSGVELKVLVLSNYNKEKLKSLKVNPDTLTQMCLQLAYYQLHKKPAPTYETATTRAFYHGRTETVRSCSPEVFEWCKQMCNQHSSSSENNKRNLLLAMFRRACDEHDRLMNDARNNFGCDRHLLGLMLMSKQLGLDLHDIFMDEAWKKSGGGGNFLISSSCVGSVPTAPLCSPFCLNGYSCVYSLSDFGIIMGLGRYKQSEETNLDKFTESLKSAINQVEHLISSSSKSKL